MVVFLLFIMYKAAALVLEELLINLEFLINTEETYGS